MKMSSANNSHSVLASIYQLILTAIPSPGSSIIQNSSSLFRSESEQALSDISSPVLSAISATSCRCGMAGESAGEEVPGGCWFSSGKKKTSRTEEPSLGLLLSSVERNTNYQCIGSCRKKFKILSRELGASMVSPNQRSQWKHAFLLLKHV